MAAKTKIFIVEDHQLLREGLKSMLAGEDDCVVVGEARDGVEAIRLIRRTKPDLVTLDLSMPRMDGFSVLRELKKSIPEVKVLVLTIHESDQYVIEAFKSGANGYCVKDSSREELRMAVRATIEGKMYISPGIAKTVLEGYLEGKKQVKTRSAWDSVTPREREILKLLGEGHQNKEIAGLLNISVKTVEKHRANIMQKLDLHNTAGLTAYAFEQGLINPKS